MARYYFHLRDGNDRVIDPEGREIDDPSRIPAMALREARSMIGHDATRGEIRLGQSIDVLDDKGELVHHLSFRDAVSITD